MDFDDLSDLDSPDKSGEYALWLRIFTLSFFELRSGKHCSQAESFLFDNNYFFDSVADELGYEPHGLRKRIRESLKRLGFVNRLL